MLLEHWPAVRHWRRHCRRPAHRGRKVEADKDRQREAEARRDANGDRLAVPGLTCVVCSPLNFQKGGSDGHLATRRLPKLTQLRLCLWQKGTWSRRATSKRVGRAVQLPAPAPFTSGQKEVEKRDRHPGGPGANGFSSIAPRAGLVASRQTFVLCCHGGWLRAAPAALGARAQHAHAVAAVAENLAWRALPCQKVLSSPDRRGPWRGRMRRRDFMAGSAATAALGVAGWPVYAEINAGSPVPKRIALVHPSLSRDQMTSRGEDTRHTFRSWTGSAISKAKTSSSSGIRSLVGTTAPKRSLARLLAAVPI